MLKLEKKNEARILKAEDLLKKHNRINPIDKSGHLLPRPFLISRIWSIIIDTIAILILIVAFEWCFSQTLFEPLGYYEKLEAVHAMYDESHLFAYSEENGYSTIDLAYDDSKTPEENYDVAITYFYSHDERALADNKLAEYNAAKISSNYFVYSGETIVRAAEVEEAYFVAFFEFEYDEAVDYFESDPIYFSYMDSSFMIIVVTILISATIATAIIYLIIPLTRKNGQSLAQIITHLAIADSRDDTRVKKWQIVVRYLVILGMDFYFPILMYAQWGVFTAIPILASLLIMCVTRANEGPQDFASKTFVVVCKDVEIPEFRKK